jgi:DNA repair protein RadA/Sms
MADMEINHGGIPNLKRGTNIKEVIVPKHMRSRKTTGMEWLNEALGGSGGCVPSQVCMLTGSPGVGKTTFFLQLADAITKAGHIALVNVGEESLYQTKLVQERLKLDSGFLVGQDIYLNKVLDHANELMDKNPGKQLFLFQDSLQTMNDGKYNDGGTTGNTPVRCCTGMTGWAKQGRLPPGIKVDKHGKAVRKEDEDERIYPIVFFIGQATKSGDFSGKNTIKHAVDTHGMLFFDDKPKSPTYGKRLFEVTKNRFGCNGLIQMLGMTAKGLVDEGSFKRGDDME